MRFSRNGYYVDKYVKCMNCGKSIYRDGILQDGGVAQRIFCSEWCVEWSRRRDLGEAQAPLPLDIGRDDGKGRSARDVVTMNILDSAMVSVCREMGISMMKTSYSTIFNEGLDFTCALADRNGDLLAVGDFCPSMIGGMPLIVKTITQEIPLSSLSEGDVIIHNDPHRGGLHLPEHTLIKPFFVDGELLGFAACIGHIAEIGGMVPGAFAGEATEIFQEGLCVPPVKIRVKGDDNVDVWKMLLANVRTPRYNYGDIRAMIGAVDLGEAQIKQIIAKYGVGVFQKTCADLMNYSEQYMRAQLKSFPDGRYSFEDRVESDGVEAGSHRLHVDVFVQGDEIVVDFTGTAPQAKGPINATLGVAMGASYNAVLHLTDPSIPKNSGAFRPIRVIAPPGTIANVNHPGAEVAGNTEVHPRFTGIILGAMAQCVPDRVMASEAGTGGNFVFGGRNTDSSGEYYVCYDVMYGGWGARANHDGNDAVVAINGNCRMNPTEVFETRFPWRVEEFALVTDSGGAGRFRGGLGFTRTLLALADEITVSQCTDHHEVAPWALFSGHEGGLGSTLIQQAETGDYRTIKSAFNKVSSSKFANVTVRKGDRLRITVPGGGGYGAPRERAESAVRQDLEEGYISPDQARTAYGLTL